MNTLEKFMRSINNLNNDCRSSYRKISRHERRKFSYYCYYPHMNMELDVFNRPYISNTYLNMVKQPGSFKLDMLYIHRKNLH